MKEKKLYFKAEKENTLAMELKRVLSRRFYRHLKYINAQYYINGSLSPLYKMVKAGDEIEIVYKELVKENMWPTAASLPRIVFENEHYLIVDKEPDILTIPIAACKESLYQQIVLYLGHSDVHILNRLDRKTSGLVVIAKDRYAASLLEPTHQHIRRTYICLVEGIVPEGGTIQNFIARSEDSNKRVLSPHGKLAISHYRVLKKLDANKTILEFQLETGRTHQIRLHTSSIGHPIIGDDLYGNGLKTERLYLTSYKVSFTDPFDQKEITICLKEGWWNQ